MERCLKVKTRLNGTPWYDATRHVLTITGATDASCQIWGGLIRGPFGAFFVFTAAAEFPTEWYNAHNYLKVTFALHEVRKLATTIHPSCLTGSTTVVDVDSKAMHDIFKKMRLRNVQMHGLTTSSYGFMYRRTLPRSSAGYAQRRTRHPTV